MSAEAACENVTYNLTKESPDGVMKLLFERGNYDMIIDNIFSYLDPPSLRSSSLVCWSWMEFIRKRFMIMPDGEKRITNNWINMRRFERQIKIVPGDVSAADDDLLRRLDDLDRPWSAVGNADYIIVSVVSSIDMYDRRAGVYSRRLHVANMDLSTVVGWDLFLSKRFLIGVEAGMNPGHSFLIFDVQDDFSRLAMEPLNAEPCEVFLASENSFLVFTEEVTEDAREIVGLCCYRIAKETLRYERLWTRSQDYPDYRSVAIKTAAGDSHWLLSERCISGTAVHLQLGDVNDGHMESEVSLECSPGRRMGEVDSIAFAWPTAVVLVRNQRMQIIIADMEKTVHLHTVDVSLLSRDRYSLSTLWCLSSINVLLLSDVEGVFLWDMRALMAGVGIATEVGNKERHTFAVHPRHDKLVYVRKAGEERFIVDCDFWRR